MEAKKRLHVKPDLWCEIEKRGLRNCGIIPAFWVNDLCDTLYHVEENPGLTHGELERLAKTTGAMSCEMKWRLVALALIGLIKAGAERNGVPTWSPSYKGGAS